jgi:prolipoprotein diacylglyceryltransferase
VCAAAWWTVTDTHGHARWPAPVVEMMFNLAFFAWAVCAIRFNWQREQRFNIYLIAYGTFRFAHEFMRDDVRWFAAFGGYHVVSLAIVGTGAWMYLQRARIKRESTTAPA